MGVRHGLLALLTGSVVLTAACSAQRESPSPVADATPTAAGAVADQVRFPDDEGVVTEAKASRFILDGERIYTVSRQVESFTTAGHTVTPIAHWQGRYVHLGLKGKSIEWIAGIGIVFGDPPVVTYSGVFQRVENGRAIFTDGTALTLGNGVQPPAAESRVVATFDVRSKSITSF